MAALVLSRATAVCAGTLLETESSERELPRAIASPSGAIALASTTLSDKGATKPWRPGDQTFGPSRRTRDPSGSRGAGSESSHWTDSSRGSRNARPEPRATPNEPFATSELPAPPPGRIDRGGPGATAAVPCASFGLLELAHPSRPFSANGDEQASELDVRLRLSGFLSRLADVPSIGRPSNAKDETNRFVSGLRVELKF